MIVVLEPFTRSSIEARFGTEVGCGAEAALRHYARRALSQQRPPEVPLFMRDVAVDRETATEVEVSLSDEVFTTLTREAHRQEVDFDRIVAHGVFVYLDDVAAAGRPGVDPAEEIDAYSRYPGHAAAQPSSPRRPRGTDAGDRLLRGARGVGGRSRFGRR